MPTQNNMDSTHSSDLESSWDGSPIFERIQFDSVYYDTHKPGENSLEDCMCMELKSRVEKTGSHYQFNTSKYDYKYIKELLLLKKAKLYFAIRSKYSTFHWNNLFDLCDIIVICEWYAEFGEMYWKHMVMENNLILTAKEQDFLFPHLDFRFIYLYQQVLKDLELSDNTEPK